MQKLLIAATVCLALLAALGHFAEAHCKVKLYRSPGMSALKLFMNSNNYVYLNLVDNHELPALMFYVKKNRVYVFDDQARPQSKALDTLRTSRDDKVSRQFRYYEMQFHDWEPAVELKGHFVKYHESYDTNRFDIEWLPDEEYNVSLEDVANFGLQYRMGTTSTRAHYKLKSPLHDLTTHIDENCRVRIARQGTEINLAQLDPIEHPPRSAQDWNPMDQNSWTLLGDQHQQAGSSSSGGFRFARPLSPSTPSVPEDPAEPESP